VKQINVVPYKSSWEKDFQNENKKIQNLLTEKVEIYHIGSTSIPNMFAVPIVDIMIAVQSLKEFDKKSKLLCTIGYEPVGETCEEERRIFMKCDGDCRYHVQIFEQGNPEIERRIAFREFMIAHTEQALEYSRLKKELANQYSNDEAKYKKGRSEFLEKIDQQASKWKN